MTTLLDWLPTGVPGIAALLAPVPAPSARGLALAADYAGALELGLVAVVLFADMTFYLSDYCGAFVASTDWYT